MNLSLHELQRDQNIVIKLAETKTIVTREYNNKRRNLITRCLVEVRPYCVERLGEVIVETQNEMVQAAWFFLLSNRSATFGYICQNRTHTDYGLVHRALLDASSSSLETAERILHQLNTEVI